MSTFFSTSFKPQPHIRQEGFHLDNEGTGGGLTATGEHHEGSGATPPPFDFGRNNVMDFTDELASLMGAASPHPGHQSHHGGHDGLSHSHHESHIHGHSGSHHESHLHGLHHHDHHGHHQHNQSHERSTHSPSDDVSGSYRTTHNIFDMGVGNPVAVSPSTTTTSATTATSHFNSTVPPLNSSMRFEQPSQHDYHHSAHTPSPPLGGKEPSRSRSRPPTGSASGGVGPQRTTRSRRNNSISSTSPPPHIRPAAQAIVIPGVRHTNGSLASPLSSSATSVTNPWGFASSSPTGTSTSEFTLPTPDSLHHHHHSNSLSHGGQHNGGHTPSTSLPVSGTIHSHLGGAGGGAGSGGHGHGHGHHRTNSAAASTTAGSASGGGSATSATTMTTQEKQAMAASEKRRRRRESHNAVERRRRDNINEKISELATLIPESLLEGGSLPPASGGPQNILPAPGSNGGDSPSEGGRVG
ncbi:hypothetical protein L218DRAFT_503480 [Marasmius fiardii PR-910]|nr:hypothetical protein L218DRAFT_503480 [Marasmius fiardii PR-910]